MRSKKKANHCVIINDGVQCLNCGDIHYLPLPMTADEFSTLEEDFGARHKNCQPTWLPPMPDPSMPMMGRLKFWYINGAKGQSVITMWNRFMPEFKIFELYQNHAAHPCDPSDFRRCYLLIRMVPEFKEKLSELKVLSSQWSKIVDNWDKLCTMLEDSLLIGDKSGKKMFEFMQSLGC